MSKDDSSNIFNILAFTFEGKDTAKETFKEVKKSGAFEGQKVVARIYIEQNEKGQVKVHETGRGGLGAVSGAVVGGVLSFLGGPVGFLTWVGTGALVGGVAGKYLGRSFKKGDLKELGEAMEPDTSALLLICEDIYSEAILDSLSGMSANAITLTVSDELSGELAQFAAGELSVDDDEDGEDDGEDE